MSADAKKPRSLTWSEPTWSFRPRLKRDFTGVLNLWMWVRIFVVSLLLVVLLAYFVTCAVPDLQFDWINAFMMAFGGIVLYLAAFTSLLWFVPPSVRINAKGVSRQFGNQIVWRKRSDIRRIILDQTLSEKPRLRVEADGKKEFDCGIAPKISLNSLVAFLGETFPDRVIEEKMKADTRCRDANKMQNCRSPGIYPK